MSPVSFVRICFSHVSFSIWPKIFSVISWILYFVPTKFLDVLVPLAVTCFCLNKLKKRRNLDMFQNTDWQKLTWKSWSSRFTYSRKIEVALCQCSRLKMVERKILKMILWKRIYIETCSNKHPNYALHIVYYWLENSWKFYLHSFGIGCCIRWACYSCFVNLHWFLVTHSRRLWEYEFSTITKPNWVRNHET